LSIPVTRTDSIKDLGVFTDSKLRLHNHVDYIFSRCVKLLGLVRTLTFSFSSLDCLHMLYFTLVRSKLEYASVVWNSITTTDANKLECIQQKFAALCYNRILSHVHYSYANVFKTPYLTQEQLDALFLIQVYRGMKYCPSLLEAVGLRVPTRYLKDVSVFNFSPSIKNCPSARCASAANGVCRDFDKTIEQKLFLSVTYYNNYGTFYLLDINSIQCKFIFTPFSLLTSRSQHLLVSLNYCYHPYDINCPAHNIYLCH
jgi:hypothetical protein